MKVEKEVTVAVEVDVLTEILDTLNYYKDEVNNNEAVTEGFIKQLKLATENFT